MRKYLFGVLLLLSSVISCGGETQRTIKGRISAAAYNRRIDNPVFVAQRPDGHALVSHVRASGDFAVRVPTGIYRLRVANTHTSGKYAVISNVTWPNSQGRSPWARVGPGNPISLGVIGSAGATSNDAGTIGNQQEKQNCGANDAQCVNDTNEVAGLQECDSDDLAVANVDEGQVNQNVDVDVDSAAADQNQDVNIICTNDSGPQDGGSSHPGTGEAGAQCRLNADCIVGLICINSACTGIK
jgi:hypothetical protein